MYSKSPLRISTFLFLLIAILSLTACNAKSAIMEFSFNTSTPSNSSDNKIIYINNDMDKLELNVELKIDSGDATVEVLSISNDEVVWSDTYQEDSNFIIELYDVKANSEYLLKIETVQSKKVNITITSDNNLIKDKEKPEKYKIEKK